MAARSVRFSLTVTMDNAAFTNPNDGITQYGPELAGILRTLADRLEASDANDDGGVMDSNGNSVGTWKVTGVKGGRR